MSLAGQDSKMDPATEARLWLNLDNEVQFYTKVTKVSMIQVADLKVAQPKPRVFWSQVCIY